MPGYVCPETNDRADEMYDRWVQEKLDDIIEAQPQACHHCEHIFAGPVCPACNTERPAFVAMKRMAA